MQFYTVCSQRQLLHPETREGAVVAQHSLHGYFQIHDWIVAIVKQIGSDTHMKFGYGKNIP